jgi:hypothetical protein
MSKAKRLKLGDDDFNAEWLRSVSEDHAIKSLGRAIGDINRVRNAWKQANGLSVRNYSQENETEKPKKKRSSKSKKKSED